MRNFDFFDSDLKVRLQKKCGRLNDKDLVYSMYVYPTRDSSLSYAVTVADEYENFAVRCVRDYFDALSLFYLISENEIDVCSLDEVANDYFYERTNTTYSDLNSEHSNMVC